MQRPEDPRRVGSRGEAGKRITPLDLASELERIDASMMGAVRLDDDETITARVLALLPHIVRTRREQEAVVEAARGITEQAHYAHNDPQGTAGANCPACLEQHKQVRRLRDALRACDRGDHHGR